jgi:hypothetical protein
LNFIEILGGVFAGFADDLAGLVVRFDGELRGELEAVQIEASLARVDAAGGERTENVVEGALNASGVFEGRKLQRFPPGEATGSVAAGGRVVVAVGLSAECGGFALASGGENMPAFVKHERDSLAPPPTPRRLQIRDLNSLGYGRVVAIKL